MCPVREPTTISLVRPAQKSLHIPARQLEKTELGIFDSLSSNLNFGTQTDHMEIYFIICLYTIFETEFFYVPLTILDFIIYLSISISIDIYLLSWLFIVEIESCLCTPGYPGTHTDLSALTFQVLGLKVYSSMPGYLFI